MNKIENMVSNKYLIDKCRFLINMMIDRKS